MRKLCMLILFVVAISIGLIAAHFYLAQLRRQSVNNEPSNGSYIAFDQLESFIDYLKSTKQTDVLQRFETYVYSSAAIQNSVDMGHTMAVLQKLRSGETNAAVELLERRPNSCIIGFAGNYRKISSSICLNFKFEPNV